MEYIKDALEYYIEERTELLYNRDKMAEYEELIKFEKVMYLLFEDLEEL